MVDVVVRGPLTGQGAACEAVLRALPDWFGIEASIVQYVADAAVLPSFVSVGGGTEGTDAGPRGTSEEPGRTDEARAGDREGEHVVGLLSLKRHAPEAAEIHVMGVLPDRHRGGVGAALLAAAEDWLRRDGVRFLSVKTLSPARPDPGYAQTRAFYRAMGFVPLMELPELWGKENPCLVMVKPLA